MRFSKKILVARYKRCWKARSNSIINKNRLKFSLIMQLKKPKTFRMNKTCKISVVLRPKTSSKQHRLS